MFFFNQKPAYDMRISDWSSDVCSSDLSRMFFNRPDFDLASAAKGSFSLAPAKAMREALRRDYAATEAMIFGKAPAFDEIIATTEKIEAKVKIGRAHV